MGLSKLTVNVGQSGLGRRPPNEDKISGLLFFSALPSGFASDDRVKKVFQTEEAETLGITVAAFPIHHYHISEYFRGNPEGELWIGIYAIPGGAYSFAEVGAMVKAAGGEIRQLGVYAGALTYASTQVTTIQTIINAIDGDGYKQFQVLYAANMEAITPVSGWSAVGDLRTLNAPDVRVVAAQDGAGTGAALFVSQSQSITCLGLAIGMTSRSKVNESIGYPLVFNLSDGLEMEVPALANSDLWSDLTPTALGGIKDDGYLIALKRIPDVGGTYFDRVPSAVPLTSDFSFIENRRVVQKAIRLIRKALVPELNATLFLNADGTLRNDTVGYFQDKGQDQLDFMLADDEFSAAKCLVDPKQNVLSTSKLVVTVKIVPTGIAEEIVVNIGLVTSL